MSQPYDVWDTRTSLGVMRDVEPTFTYWTDLLFTRQLNSQDEYIDFEKLPALTERIAPFVRPMGTGKPIYKDSARAYRFKPAYIKLKDVIDPLMPLTRRPGIDNSMLAVEQLSPTERRNAIRAAMTVAHVQAIQRRLEWMAARAAIDASYTVEGEEYPAVNLDFQRDANHTVNKTAGNYWGDTGVSIFDDIQRWADRMFDAKFGGFPTRLTIGSSVWAVMRQDQEILDHMDTNIREPRATVERGVIASDKVVPVGNLLVGGASGASIEVMLYRDTYIDDAGVEQPFMTPNSIVMTASAERYMGYRCYGAIIDPYAQYQPVEIFPRNWMEMGDPAVEYILHQSSPLMVPINPNCSFHATVVA